MFIQMLISQALIQHLCDSILWNSMYSCTQRPTSIAKVMRMAKKLKGKPRVPSNDGVDTVAVTS